MLSAYYDKLLRPKYIFLHLMIPLFYAELQSDLKIWEKKQNRIMLDVEIFVQTEQTRFFFHNTIDGVSNRMHCESIAWLWYNSEFPFLGNATRR